MPSASCCLFRHMYSSTYDGRCRYVTLYNVFLASRLPCTPTSGPVWYRFRVDTSRQVDELLTVIHSLVINHGRNKIVFVYSLNDWHKFSTPIASVTWLLHHSRNSVFVTFIILHKVKNFCARTR